MKSNTPGLTPSQTVGPYLHIGLDWLNTTELAAADVAGGDDATAHGSGIDDIGRDESGACE